MKVNFQEALAMLLRALPLVLFRAVYFVAGGFLVILLFGLLLFVLRPGTGAGQTTAVMTVVLTIAAGWIISLVGQRFFLYRYQAAMLFMFSGRFAPAPGKAGAVRAAARFFPDHSRWAAQTHRLSRFLAGERCGHKGSPPQPEAQAETVGRLASGLLAQAIIAVAFERGGIDTGQSIRKGASLYLRHGAAARKSARSWLGFSALGLAFIFILIALPNGFFFNAAGAPVWIGIVLAMAMAWVLFQAFVFPFALAGVSGALLAETPDQKPDEDLCLELTPLFPDLGGSDPRAD